MKYNSLKLIAVILSLVCLTGLQAQESVNITGGNATGTGGSVTYSVGQLVYEINSGSSIEMTQGVQQPSPASSTFQTDGNWNSSGNWSAGIPTTITNAILAATCNVDGQSPAQNVTVYPGVALTISQGNTLAAYGNFLLKSDAPNGTATLVNSGTLTVTGTSGVEQYLTAKTGAATTDNWWYVASPVSGASSAVFAPQTSTNKMGFYNEPTVAYSQISNNSTQLTPAKGYVVSLGGAVGSSATYIFSGGALNDGNIPLTVSRTGTNAGKRGFNLVGNPYPSYVNWNDITQYGTSGVRTDIKPTIWYRVRTNSGSMMFDTFDGTIGTDNGKSGEVSQYIPPMQAFWMKVVADNSTPAITFTNSMRSHRDQNSSTNRLRAKAMNPMQIIRIKVSNGVNSDAAIVLADANAQDTFDSYDAQKMPNDNAEIPEIYTLAGSEELVINHLNNFSTDKQLSLGFRPGKSGDFTIETTEISNLDSQLKVILLDKLNYTEHEIPVGSPYLFSSDDTATNSRFSIVFKSASNITGYGNTDNDDSLLIYSPRQNEILVVCKVQINNTSSVSVYNAIGQKLIQQGLSGTTTGINGLFIPGVYIVTVSHNGQKSTKRVVVNK